jgi:hypothetical protein
LLRAFYAQIRRRSLLGCLHGERRAALLPSCAPAVLRALVAAVPPRAGSCACSAPTPAVDPLPPARPETDSPGRHARARPAPVDGPLPPARPETVSSPGWHARAPGPAIRAQLWLQAAAARPPCCAPAVAAHAQCCPPKPETDLSPGRRWWRGESRACMRREPAHCARE